MSFALTWNISNSSINNSQGHMDLLHYTVLIYIIVKFHIFLVVEIMKNVILSHSTTSLKGLNFKRFF